MKKSLIKLLALSAMAVFALSGCGTTDPVEADGEDQTSLLEEEGTYVYATMNIPYDDFFAAELDNNDGFVDAVTSVTTSKWISYSTNFNQYSTELADGSGGGVIYGPSYPVLMSEELFNELSTLGETEDYYVVAYEGEPTYYKEVAGEVGNLEFSEVITDAVTSYDLDSYTWSYVYPSNWGDFEFKLTDIPTMSIIYAMEVVSDNGKSYGMRALENIWSSGKEISWGLGFKEVEAKGNTLLWECYEDIQGTTITELIYYTDEGIITIEADIYVPVFYAVELFQIGEASGKTSALQIEDLTAYFEYEEDTVIPADCDYTFQVLNSDGEEVDYFTLSDDQASISWSADLLPGSYTIQFIDANGVYMFYGQSVTFQTDNIPVEFNEDTMSFEAAAGVSEDVAAAYIASINSYSVMNNATEESASYSSTSGKSTVVPLFNEDGAIDLTAEGADGAIYVEGETYTISFTVTGYSSYSITFTV